MELHPLIDSSTDPLQVSAKVSGLILAASSSIIFFAEQFLHLTITTGDVALFASELGMTAGAIWFVFGIIRHLVVKTGTIK